MEKTYQRSDDVVLRDIAGETFLIPIRGDIADLRRIYSLDPVGRFVWERMDRPATLKSLSEALVDAYDVDRPTAEADVREFAAGLVEASLAREL